MNFADLIPRNPETSASLPIAQCVRRWLLLSVNFLVACSAASSGGNEPYKWTRFVNVGGQPEAVPAEWVAAAEGKFAHSIKLPDAIPTSLPFDFAKAKLTAAVPGKPSVSDQYFEHLCTTDAGEFILTTVENVDGLFFMRPPHRPTDSDLMDRYRLEAPGIERTFQLRRASPEERAKIFVNPPWARFSFTEEPNPAPNASRRYVQSYGYLQDATPMKVDAVDQLKSKFGLVWRGLRRPRDREFNIAGSEWIVIDLRTYEVLAVQRDYAKTGLTRNAPQGIWWLNASNCPNSTAKHILGSQIYEFVVKALRPSVGDSR